MFHEKDSLGCLFLYIQNNLNTIPGSLNKNGNFVTKSIFLIQIMCYILIWGKENEI